MDAYEASKPDRLSESLSSAWASFLSAQQCGREIGALRRRLDEHAQHTTSSIASLQRDAASRQDQVSTALAECKSRAEVHGTQSLKEMALLRAELAAIQQEFVHVRGQLTANHNQLSERADAQQGTLDGLRSTTAQDVRALQEQHRSALERIEIMQRELRETKEEKITLEERLVALNDRVTAIDETPHKLSEETVKFLQSVFSRRHELMLLLDTPHDNIQASQPKPTVHNPQDYRRLRCPAPIPSPDTQPSLANRAEATQENIYALNEAKPNNDLPQVAPPSRQAQPQGQPQPTSNQPQQDIRALYLLFRDRYKADPPKSDTAFIWEFLGAIESPAMAEYVQESLATILPQYVARSRDTRRRNPRRHVTIARGLTWRRFREALVEIPGPGY